MKTRDMQTARKFSLDFRAAFQGTRKAALAAKRERKLAMALRNRRQPSAAAQQGGSAA